jgi:protein gp37
MTATKIEWTDEVWNPVTGCSKVSRGCAHCYAERLFPRVYGRDRVPVNSGAGITNRDPDPANNEHFRTRRFSDVRCHPERLEQPLHWRKPRRIFVNSMSDLFHESVPDEFIYRVFYVMTLAKQHTYQVLTKRPERMLKIACELISSAEMLSGKLKRSLPMNIWLGVSCEDQATADERIPLLLQTPAAVRFVSLEPMLGQVNASRYLREFRKPGSDSSWFTAVPGSVEQRLLDWIIVGGESGPKARPMHPDWARSVRDQCMAAGVPYFFKQWGEWLPDDQCGDEPFYIKPGHPGAPKWAIDRPVCHLSPGLHAFKVGKKRAGRLLDGREWDEFPHGRS